MLDSAIQVVVLGLIQGFAEWLPISSTAHLRMAEHFFGWNVLQQNPFFNITLHVGTLVAVVFYFRKEVKSILSALVHVEFESEYGQLIPPIIVATVPTTIVGLLYTKFLEDTLQTMMLAIGLAFLIGATIVYTSRTGKENTETITYKMALIMGTAQGLAVFSGLSRSGMTISAALLLGLRREKAFKFSFLLSIPAIAGDFAVEAYRQRSQLSLGGVGPPGLLAGVVIAMVAGYVAIKLVSNTVRSRRFHYFAVYTGLIGIALIALTLSGF